MEKTLEENGVVDEAEALTELGLPDDYYVPALHLYFNDGTLTDGTSCVLSSVCADLTIA